MHINKVKITQAIFYHVMRTITNFIYLTYLEIYNWNLDAVLATLECKFKF